jgi:glycosyltransferase involved in cell wall biosynthesis
MKVVVSMIVRDEAERYQPHLAEQALQYADELRILDDGSRDGTAELLRGLGPEVRLVRNRLSRWEAAGEGVARQQLLEWTLAAGADWVIQLDADELIADGAALRDILADGACPDGVWSLRMMEVWKRHPAEWLIRVDGGWAPREVGIVWRPPPVTMTAAEAWSLGWTIPQQRLACGREPEVVRMVDQQPAYIDVLHLGWSDPRERQKRYDRYMAIDGGRHHDSAHLRSIMEPPELQPYPAVEL